MKLTVDCLGSMGDPISLQKHIDMILEGWPQEYESIIERKFEPLPTEEF